MDKRSIIGFVLILAILLLWGQWNKMFNPPPEQQETTQQEQPETITQAPETTPAVGEQSTGRALEQPSPGEVALDYRQATEPEKLIQVETEDVIVTLSSYGGLVKSIQLKKYFTVNGYNGDSLVEMISTPDISPWRAEGALTLGDKDNLNDVNHIAYKVEGNDIFILQNDQPQTVSFVYKNPEGGSIRKDYTFFADGYEFKLRLNVNKPNLLGFDKKLTLSWLMPVLPTESDFQKDLDKFAGFYNMGAEVVENKDLKEGKLFHVASGTSKWVALRSKYFTNVIITDTNPGSEIVVVGQQAELYDLEQEKHNWKKFGVGLTFDLQQESFSNDFTIYSGPQDYYRLKGMGYNLTQLIDMGWKVFRPFAIGILWIFIQLHKVLFNYGLVIIVFSILMKIIFWPLTRKSSASMLKMKELQPKLQEMKAKFKDDPRKQQAETMKVYKEFGVNPFGSCLPMLVQLPIFWAMFSILNNSIEIRAAGFILWITDLSQKDPYYILAIIMAAAMFLQQKMTITDPKQKMLVYLMPLVFLFIFGSMPSGLVLYWTMFSIIGIFEQLLVKRKLELEKESAPG